jgi:hypothetical protein
MSYTLTLSWDERRAIDWIGGRYFHGSDLRRLLWLNCSYDDNLEWDGHDEISFSVPEHVAWHIRDGAELEDFQWTCFGPALRDRMQSFCDNIV